MKRFFEKLVEGALLISGSITSITILLIILFLFKEASGLFTSPVIEEGYVLAFNKSNPVKKLTSYEIKEIFDGKISNWNEVGGKNEAIELVRLSDLTKYYTEAELGANFENIPAKASELTGKHPGIVLFLPTQYVGKNFNYEGKFEVGKRIGVATEECNGVIYKTTFEENVPIGKSVIID